MSATNRRKPTVAPCKNPECTVTVHPNGRRRGYCEACDKQLKRNGGARPCSICGKEVIRNFGRGGGRQHNADKHVFCRTCEPKKARWAQLYRSCRACDSPAGLRGDQGLCLWCENQRQRFGQRQCRECGGTTYRNFSHAKRVLCKQCFRQKLALVIAAYRGNATPYRAALTADLDRPLVRRIYEWLGGDEPELQLKSFDVFGEWLQQERFGLHCPQLPSQADHGRFVVLQERALAGDETAWGELWEYAEQRTLPGLFAKYFLPREEAEDLVTLAKLGFVEAIQSWKPELAPLPWLIRLVAERKIKTWLTAVNRTKRQPFLTATSLDQPVTSQSGNDRTLYNIVSARAEDPADVVEREEEERREVFLPGVSGPLEHKIVAIIRRCVLEEDREPTYQEIADELGIPRKSVDNALQRIRRRAREEQTET